MKQLETCLRNRNGRRLKMIAQIHHFRNIANGEAGG